MHVTVNNKLPTTFDCYTAVIVRAKHDKMHNCYMHPFAHGNWLEFKKTNTSRYAIVFKATGKVDSLQHLPPYEFEFEFKR